MEQLIVTVDVPNKEVRKLPERQEFTDKERRVFCRGLAYLLAFQAGALAAIIIILLVR